MWRTTLLTARAIRRRFRARSLQAHRIRWRFLWPRSSASFSISARRSALAANRWSPARKVIALSRSSPLFTIHAGASGASASRRNSCAARGREFDADLFLEKPAADHGRVPRRGGIVRHTVELDYCPALVFHFPQRVEYGEQIHPAPPEFDKLERVTRILFTQWDIHAVLDVKQEEPVVIFLNGRGRIAAACHGMCRIEKQLYVLRIRILHHHIEIRRVLADGVHVVVVDQRHTHARGALAEFRQQLS